MAVVLGTNAGFVETAPAVDPDGTLSLFDNSAQAIKDTTPATAGKITEIGWWCDNATQEANFEVALYSHHAGNDKPDERLYVDNTNAKGTDSGWKKVVVDWEISPETIYWIAVQLDDTATATYTNRNEDATKISYKFNSPTFVDPWSALSTESIWCRAFYALCEVGVSYSELTGTCVGTGDGSGDLELHAYSALTGTCAGIGAGSGDLGSILVHISEQIAYKHLIVVGNNQVWIEDI